MAQFGRFLSTLGRNISRMAQSEGLWSFAAALYPFCLTSDQVSSKSSKWLARKCQKPLKKCMKIGHFRVKFSPWRRKLGKNLMRRTGKEIYRRFWISNQIFSSIYRSWDIGLSLDTTFAIFGQNLNFVDEYLENGNFFGHAVFARCSELISSTFWPSFIKIVRAIFEKKSKNCHFDHIFVLFGWSKIFLDNPALSLSSL